jgi:hypothetical protein
VAKKTGFGTRVIDVEIWKNEKMLGGIETKVGKSVYHVLQRMKDDWLYANKGYKVELLRKSAGK